MGEPAGWPHTDPEPWTGDPRNTVRVCGAVEWRDVPYTHGDTGEIVREAVGECTEPPDHRGDHYDDNTGRDWPGCDAADLAKTFHQVGRCPVCGAPIFDSGYDDDPAKWWHPCEWCRTDVAQCARDACACECHEGAPVHTATIPDRQG